MKNFWTAQDIENLAAQGKRELVIDDTAVLTDLARHMADQLGIAEDKCLGIDLFHGIFHDTDAYTGDQESGDRLWLFWRCAYSHQLANIFQKHHITGSGNHRILLS